MTTNLTRFCPQCDATTTARLCPHDGTVTLMSEPPAVDVDKVAVPGAIIDHRYQLVRLLGKGGFGAVFAAKHTGTGHEVALKILHATDDLAMLKRFFREARVTAALRSRHTIRVIDFGQDDQGVTYLAMELLKGRTVDAWLSQRLRAGEVLSEAEAIEIAIAVCKSLGEAHAAGLVHRDLKPQNLFQADTEDGPVLKVLDFGIVKVHDQSLTGDSIIGTTAYMSPEQALSQKLDGRSDLYSLGAMLYELVGGSVPFSADTPVQVLLMQINAEPEPLKDRAKVPISDEFAQLVMGLLAKHPEQRPADAADLLAQLTALRGKANTATKKTSLRVQGLRGFGEPEEDDATRTAESARAMTAATA
ncbi:MAG: protein kinase, partial [Deltaproteobacteria bacterium]|nr:protein kinase [Deltaproteobacteria bacterium]